MLGLTALPSLGTCITLLTLEAKMPSKNPRQARLMAAAAHDPKFAKRVGVPQAVAKEFNKADAKTGILKKKKR